MNPAIAGPLFAFLASVTWAVGSSSYSKLSRSHRPMDLNLTRAIFALPCFVLAVFITFGGWSGGIEAFRSLEAHHYGWFAASILCSYGLGDSIFMLSTISLGVPGALAIASSYPILTTLAGVYFADQPLAPLQWVGLGLAIAGIIIVILNDPQGTPKGGTEVSGHPKLRKKSVGVALAVVTAFFWGMNAFTVSKGGATIDAMLGNSIRMAMGLFVISIVSWVTTRQPAKIVDRVTCRRYAWVFIFEGFVGSYAFVYGLSHTSLVLGSVLTSLAPVLAVPVSVALKLERFSWVRSAAVATVVVGLSLLFR